MDPSRIPNATRTLGQPEDWNEAVNGPCGGLAIKDTVYQDHKVMISEWTPSYLELEQLNAGGKVQLWVWGSGHPPVAIGVSERKSGPFKVN